MEYCAYEDAFPTISGEGSGRKKPDPDRLTPKMEPAPLSREPKKRKKASYFTASPDEDVIGNETSYRLYPDFQSAFKRVVSEAAASGVPSVPSVVDEWKPLTPVRTAFFDDLPAPGGSTPPSEPSVLAKKIDLLFSRLDDLESRRGENTQTEILMFVMSGLFVLFSMDILTRHA